MNYFVGQTRINIGVLIYLIIKINGIMPIIKSEARRSF